MALITSDDAFGAAIDGSHLRHSVTTQPFLALPLPSHQRLMPLLVARQPGRRKPTVHAAANIDYSNTMALITSD